MVDEVITIDDLLEDLHFKSLQKDREKGMFYVEKMRDLVDWLANPRFDVIPYVKDNGDYDFRLRIANYER